MNHRSERLGRSHLWVTAAGLAAVVSFIAAALTWTPGQPSVAQGPPMSEQSSTTAGPAESASPDDAPHRPPAAERTAGQRTAGQPRRVAPRTELPGAGAPQRILIESLGIDAPVLPIVTDGSTLNPPPDPQDLGWWAEGARPGAVSGTALITGHTVHDGGGALDHLETLRPGTEIRVRTASGIIGYVAESIEVLDKDTIARRAPQLFSQQVSGRLVLVTCEDWDGSGYRSNVVVTAAPLA